MRIAVGLVLAALAARDGDITGVVVDEAGVPVAGALVAGGNTAARTDAEGRFTLKGLAARAPAVEVKARARGLYARPAHASAGGGPLRIVMQKAARLHGRVEGDGGPVEGAKVRGVLVLDGRTRFHGHAETDAEGRFSLRELPPEPGLALRVEHPRFETLDMPRVLGRDPAQTFLLSPGVRAGGVFVDEDGAPVREAWLWVRYGEERKRVRTDRDGRWLAGGLAAGEILVELDAMELGFLPETFRTKDGVYDARFVARRGETITGRVAWKRRWPARINAHADGRRVGSARVEHDGTFVLRGLPPGVYTLRVVSTAGEIRDLARAEGVASGTKDLAIPVVD